MKNTNNSEREVVVLLTDMKQYAKLSASMTTEQIRDFIIDYQQSLQHLVITGENGAQAFEPFAGDSAIAIFEDKSGDDGKEKCKRALKVAINLAKAIEAEEIPYTRIGIFVGKIIEAQFEKLTLRFGNSLSAASRLEELCAYFGTTFLMDRDIALAQDEERKYVVSIAKVTPKNFHHPIHVYTVYKPGIHNCPLDIKEEKLREFILLKNVGIEHLVGNAQSGILQSFQLAAEKLSQAADIFKEITGVADMATVRILDYIRETPYPPDTFEKQGMMIDEKQGGSMGIRLFRLSQQLFKAIDEEVYKTLVENTYWENYFKVGWIEKGDCIIHINDQPDGIYYLVKGKVRVEDGQGNMITELSEGEIFGEMAYFSQDKKRTASVVAVTDVVVRKISSEDFGKFSVLQNIFAAIAKKRLPPSV
jgi:class 3 adenylate cyclase